MEAFWNCKSTEYRIQNIGKIHENFTCYKLNVPPWTFLIKLSPSFWFLFLWGTPLPFQASLNFKRQQQQKVVSIYSGSCSQQWSSSLFCIAALQICALLCFRFFIINSFLVFGCHIFLKKNTKLFSSYSYVLPLPNYHMLALC